MSGASTSVTCEQTYKLTQTMADRLVYPPEKTDKVAATLSNLAAAAVSRRAYPTSETSLGYALSERRCSAKYDGPAATGTRRCASAHSQPVRELQTNCCELAAARSDARLRDINKAGEDKRGEAASASPSARLLPFLSLPAVTLRTPSGLKLTS